MKKNAAMIVVKNEQGARVLELSCKANAIELARIAEPQPIM